MINRQFQVLLADTRESLRLNYVIRYRVFCVETGFEDPDQFPDKMERDRYDEQSVHFLVRARETGQWVAGMRLVLGPAQTLPLVERCTIDTDVGIHPEAVSAEISRLCVVGGYRRRRQEHTSPHVIPWDRKQWQEAKSTRLLRLERRGNPEILLRLIHAAAEYGRLHQINYGYALMSESLMRILKAMGLNICPIGPACQHRGTRRPYFMTLDALFSGVKVGGDGLGRVLFSGPAYQRYSEWKESTVRIPVLKQEASFNRR